MVPIVQEPSPDAGTERGSSVNESACWDQVYQNQGRIWGGRASLPIPALPEQSRVLELGCGDGKMASVLAEQTTELIALDFSPHACRLTRKALIGSAGADVMTADARAIPLRAGSLDAVIASHVLGHLREDDRIRLADEALRILKSGGLFVVCDFSDRDFRAGTGREVGHRTYLRGNGVITHYFTEDEIRDLSCGLEIVQMTTHCRQMRIRGRSYPRADVVAVMRKG